MASAAHQEYTSSVNYATFSTEVDVVFVDTSPPIGSCQQDNFSKLTVKLEELTQSLLFKVLDYYKASYQDYRAGWSTGGTLSGAELEKHLPVPGSPDALIAHLTPIAIYFPPESKCNEGTLGISFDCTWDIKSGLGVYIKNWEIKEVSTSEIAFIYFQ